MAISGSLVEWSRAVTSHESAVSAVSPIDIAVDHVEAALLIVGIDTGSCHSGNSCKTMPTEALSKNK